MQLRLTRGEYWLLETAVSGLIPIAMVCGENYKRPDGIDVEFNKPGHGLNRGDLIDTLNALICGGLLVAYLDDKPYIINKDEITSAMNEQSPGGNASSFFYGLSAHGGAIWEEFASPRWEHCIVDEKEYDRQAGVITSMSLRRLTHYVSNLHLMGFEIDRNSLIIDACGKWRPTYWKTLPAGHKARFHWIRETVIPCQFAFAGMCDFRDGWYRWR